LFRRSNFSQRWRRSSAPVSRSIADKEAVLVSLTALLLSRTPARRSNCRAKQAHQWREFANFLSFLQVAPCCISNRRGARRVSAILFAAGTDMLADSAVAGKPVPTYVCQKHRLLKDVSRIMTSVLVGGATQMPRKLRNFPSWRWSVGHV